MLSSDPGATLLLAHERARELREDAAAEHLRRAARTRRASVTRRALAASMRGAANRLDPTPLRHRSA